ncbi:metal ABC transporter ATP-binding protein [Zafaria sp. Z1313]|uniref:metal ABC transporter ATP-binding protein n=1 Tax=unclassified Zafaria TaxID=2828765 RepID=UPI002E776065|nr:metal ABC transporter ATP-binding protein [Zafaria sp. J156]MEE1622184.1 metal ABC transporter ATP-binding protein [Zafaria sp. J156]
MPRDPRPGPPAIDVSSLTVRYGTVAALESVDFRLPAGELCGLIGVNGSGKSTLFKSLMGLVAPSSGTVRLFGGGPGAARKAGRISYVPQSEAVDWDFPVSVHDVVMMGRYGHMGLSRRPAARDKAAVAEALGRVDLAGLAGRQIGELSGGQRKRAFVARGLAQEAGLLLLDEPFAGVDRVSERMISAVLEELRAEGRTILISTHDLAGVPSLCTSALLLHRRVLATGAPSEVLTEANLAQAFGTSHEEAGA